MQYRSKSVQRNLLTLLLVLCGATAASAQTPDRSAYVISAKAGGVNLVSGDVAVRRGGAGRVQRLTNEDALESRDVVVTGATGRVELLLTPGSYLRVAENSEVEFTDTQLESLRVRLNRGGAVVEVAGVGDGRTLVEATTPQTSVRLDRKGLYRVNALADGRTEVFVRKGQALVGNTKVKGERMIVVGSGADALAVKFDKNAQDAFDLWSGQRAASLVAANRHVSRQTLASAYGSYRRSAWAYGRGYRPFGLWLYDPHFGSNTFLPFYAGLSSPYGHGYAHGFGFSQHNHFGGSGLQLGGGLHSRSHRSGIGIDGGHTSSGHRSTGHSAPRHISSGHHARGH